MASQEITPRWIPRVFLLFDMFKQTKTRKRAEIFDPLRLHPRYRPPDDLSTREKRKKNVSPIADRRFNISIAFHFLV
jgi:hypothetical protein